MTDELLSGIISDKANIRQQLTDTSTLTGAGTTVALPIFLCGKGRNSRCRTGISQSALGP